MPIDPDVQTELDKLDVRITVLEGGPPPPPPPPPPPSGDLHPIPSDAVELNPSTFTQSKVDSLGSGAHIVLTEASYKGSTVTLKTDQELYGYGRDVSIFDGENSRGEALKLASGVLVAHLGFTRYKGAGAAGDGPIGTVSNATLYDFDTWRNHKSGLRCTGQATVQKWRSYENGQYAASGAHPKLLEDYEWWGNAYPNIPGVPPHGDSNKGGSKFVKSNGGLDLRGNVHHNDGMGWWADIGNAGIVVEDLHSWENVRHGVISEANLGPMIFRRVNSHDNGPTVPAAPSKIRWAQMFTSLTGNVTMEDCVVKGRVGITAYQWNHSQIGQFGSGIALKNLLVQRCTIDAEIAAGIVYYTSSLPSPLTANNKWLSNTYLGSPQFVWQQGDTGPLISRAAWGVLGMS